MQVGFDSQRIFWDDDCDNVEHIQHISYRVQPTAYTKICTYFL
jgi:hypothetical protein